MKINNNYKPIENVPEYALILKQARLSKHILQTKIAKGLGVSHMQVSHFEKGVRIPRIDVLDKWCKLVGIELEITLSPISKSVK